MSAGLREHQRQKLQKLRRPIKPQAQGQVKFQAISQILAEDKSRAVQSSENVASMPTISVAREGSLQQFVQRFREAPPLSREQRILKEAKQAECRQPDVTGAGFHWHKVNIAAPFFR